MLLLMDKQKELMKQIKMWLTEKNISQKCPECGSENHELLDNFGVISSSSLTVPAIPNPRKGLTVVVLGCLDCAFMRVFSANIMGVVPNMENNQ